jgi:hypothetical protein
VLKIWISTARTGTECYSLSVFYISQCLHCYFWAIYTFPHCKKHGLVAMLMKTVSVVYMSLPTILFSIGTSNSKLRLLFNIVVVTIMGRARLFDRFRK